MITTKADKLLRSLMDAGLSLTEFTILATKILRIQHDLKLDNEDRRQRDHQRQNIRLREQNQFEQQLKDEEQRRLEGQNKLRQLGQTPIDDISSIIPNSTTIDNSDPFALPYSKHINRFKQRQKDCCLIFNIDYDLRRNQQGLERACKRAKRNIYEVKICMRIQMGGKLVYLFSFVLNVSIVRNLDRFSRLKRLLFIIN